MLVVIWCNIILIELPLAGRVSGAESLGYKEENNEKVVFEKVKRGARGGVAKVPDNQTEENG